MRNNIFIKIAKKLIIILIFLLPIFFLPGTSERFEYNKFNLLFLFSSLAFIFWLAGMVKNKKLELRHAPLDYPIITFIFILLLSSQFSLNRHQSIFGLPDMYHMSWLAWLGLGMFYFVFVNLFNSRETAKIFYYYLASVGIAAIIALLADYGLLIELSNGSFLNISGGSAGNLAFLASAALIMIIIFLIFSIEDIKKFKYLIIIAGVLILLLLIIINHSLAWWGLLAGSIVASGLAAAAVNGPGRGAKGAYLKILPLFIPLFISGLFILAPDNSLKYLINPAEIKEPALALSQSLNISRQAVKDRPVLGGGPGTFGYLFSQYRGRNYNYLPNWQIRHTQAGSFIFELVATAGIAAVLSYALIIGLFLYFIFFFIFKGLIFKQAAWPLYLAFSAAAIALIVEQAIYTISIAGIFSFLMFLAVISVYWQEAARDLRPAGIGLFKKNQYCLKSRQALIAASFGGLIVFSGLIALISILGKYCLADYYFAKAGGKTELMAKAVNLNSGRYQYQLILSQQLLNKIKTMSAATTDYQRAEIQGLINESVNRARAATEIAPGSVAAWETLGIVYRDIAPLASGSREWAARAFAEALKLEPSNPVIATELGKTYLNFGETDKAVVAFNNAILLKEDYYDARLSLARAYIRKNNYREAEALLEKLIFDYPDPEVFYELGRLYYNQGRVDSAISNFKKVITLAPNHSNAFFSLGLAYELKGRPEEALAYFKKVLELNPDNREVINKIYDIEDGMEI